jgi:hypothetical protein
MCVSAGPLLSGEAGSGAEGCVAVPDPSCMVRRGPKSLDTWQRWSPPRRRGGVQSLKHVAASGPSLSKKAGSDAVVARGSA